MKPKSFLDVQLPQVGLFVGLEMINEGWSGSGGGYERQVDSGASTADNEYVAKRKQAKEVHFAFLQKNYVPLEENEGRQKAKEEKKAKRKEKYKKYKKVLHL